MANFHVTWEIDIQADTPRQAAQKALKLMRDPGASVTVFGVRGEGGEQSRIDLPADGEDKAQPVKPDLSQYEDVQITVDEPERRTRKTRSKTVTCQFCGRQVPARTAHLHGGGWVGDECCWTDQLHGSE